MNLFAGLKVIFVINPDFIPIVEKNFIHKHFTRKRNYMDVVSEYLHKESEPADTLEHEPTIVHTVYVTDKEKIETNDLKLKKPINYNLEKVPIKNHPYGAYNYRIKKPE